ncbi:MAG: prepilin-type N-terminal cleavage/methylation domain-containing protein [Bacilli bacterium]|nr:prepilin-type N-terminal cleavage/methylation domain-containing protein [Bacilli bacterium]
MTRKKNGMTIVEVLISILLISIVVALLFNMLIQIRNEDVDNTIQSNFLLSQAMFTKTVEEDAINYGVSRVSSCNLTDANISIELLNSAYANEFKCIRIDYAADYTEDNIGFLMAYNTFEKYDVVNGKYQGIQDTSSWMIQYIRGHYEKDQSGHKLGDPAFSINYPDVSTWKSLTQTMRSLPADIDMSYTSYINYTAAPSSTIGGIITNYNAANLVMPIVNPDGEHYDINIAFTFNGNNNFKCDMKKPKSLDCRCKSSNSLCQNTYQY